MRPSAILKSFANLSLGYYASRAVGVISAALLGRFLGPTQAGLYATLVTVFGFLIATVNWGSDNLGIRLLARGESDWPSASKRVAGVRIAVGVGIAILSCVGFAVLRVPVVFLVPLLVALGAFVIRADWALLAIPDTRWAALAMLVREVGFLGALVIVLGNSRSLTLALWCFAGAEGVWSLASVWLASRKVPRSGGRLSPPVGWMLSEGWPFAIVSLMVMTGNKIDVPLITAFLSPADAALYWAGYTLVFAAFAIASSLSSAVLPGLTRSVLESESEANRGTFRLALASGLASGPLALVISLGGGWLVGTIYGSEFRGGGVALSVLALSIPARFVSTMLSCRLVAEGRQRMWSVAAGTGAGLNLVLNLALIPRYGIVGAAWATVASEWSMFGVLLLDSWRRDEVKAVGASLVWVGMCTWCCTFVGRLWLREWGPSAVLGALLVLSACFAPILYFWRGWELKHGATGTIGSAS